MPISYSSQVSPESKMRSPDRVFKLEVMEGARPVNSIGIVDPRLFKEGPEMNRLHAVMDRHTSLWSLKYDKGKVPEALNGQFTGFKQAYEHAKNYFEKRNIKITQVYD